MDDLIAPGIVEASLFPWGYRRPDARDDKAQTDEDTPVEIDLLANDKHAAGIFCIEGEYVRPGDTVVLDSGASVTLTHNGKVIYDPSESDMFDQLDDGEQALDSFSYSIYSKYGIDEATVHVAVDGITDEPVGNQAPVASNDFVIVPYNPFPVPYPKPIPLPLADADPSSSAVSGAPTLTPVDGPIVTTLAIGEEGDPAPLPDSIDIFPLKNDYDPDGDPITIGTINGEMVKPGDVVTLSSGATLTVSDDGTHLTYSGGLLGSKASSLAATDDVMAMLEASGGDALLYPPEYPDPVPLPLPLPPIFADVFTYQASDGEALSNEASVAVVRGFPFDIVSTDPVTTA